MSLIAGRTLEEWCTFYPLLEKIIHTEEVNWINEKKQSFSCVSHDLPVGKKEINEAQERLQRFAPFIAKAFSETAALSGLIESPLSEIPHMKQAIESYFHKQFEGRLFLKEDHALPIAGSIKARGGIYEVLKHAETLAVQHGLLSYEDDYSKLDSDEFRQFYSQYAISVGSTGNLGLSIGIISARLGFRVTVHMSSDAKQWKKELLRSKGVKVIEYETDYNQAVDEGRKQCLKDEKCYFIDDENSKDLFLGYAVAAKRLKKQLDNMKIKVDEEHPLFVYLPCGVGGGPGGVTFGLKHVFGDHVHCFFAEPTHSPSMLVGMMTDQHEQVSVQDFGIDNVTEADGLAVGTPSRFVGKLMEPLLSGIYTVSDDELYTMLAMLADSEQVYLEPSALAGMAGPVRIQTDYAIHSKTMPTHLVWATGGSLVPEEIMRGYYEKGEALLRS